jgi:hypothetical protein
MIPGREPFAATRALKLREFIYSTLSGRASPATRRSSSCPHVSALFAEAQIIYRAAPAPRHDSGPHVVWSTHGNLQTLLEQILCPRRSVRPASPGNAVGISPLVTSRRRTMKTHSTPVCGFARRGVHWLTHETPAKAVHEAIAACNTARQGKQPARSGAATTPLLLWWMAF